MNTPPATNAVKPIENNTLRNSFRLVTEGGPRIAIVPNILALQGGYGCSVF
jgi:hypothetical protein